MNFKSIILAATTFALISNLALADSTFRISEDGKTIRSHRVDVSDVINADSATSYQLVAESSEQIDLLKNNQVAYTSLIDALLIRITANGEAIENSISELRYEKVKLTKKQMATLKKKIKVLKAAQDKNDRFSAYLRALAVCIQMVPVNNESMQRSTMGIQSKWCQDMRQTQEAKYVAEMLLWHSFLTDSKIDESYSNAQVINEAIQSLVKTKYIKMK